MNAYKSATVSAPLNIVSKLDSAPDRDIQATFDKVGTIKI